MKRYTIAATGHRPDKLFGYDLYDPRWQALGRKMKEFIINKSNWYGPITCISGMALGVDQLFALVALKLRDTGYNIKVIAALPCFNQNKKWKDDSYWKNIMDRVDEKVFVHEGEYVPWCMQKRNEWMVDNADEILAVWDGTNGGTSNCIKYAEKQNKEVYNIYSEFNRTLMFAEMNLQ